MNFSGIYRGPVLVLSDPDGCLLPAAARQARRGGGRRQPGRPPARVLRAVRQEFRLPVPGHQGHGVRVVCAQGGDSGRIYIIAAFS